MSLEHENEARKAKNRARMARLRSEPDFRADERRRDRALKRTAYAADPAVAERQRAYREQRKQKLLAEDPDRLEADKQKKNAARKKRRQDPDYRARENTRMTAATVLHRYGITVDQRDEMLRAQGGMCVICQTTVFLACGATPCTRKRRMWTTATRPAKCEASFAVRVIQHSANTKTVRSSCEEPLYTSKEP